MRPSRRAVAGCTAFAALTLATALTRSTWHELPLYLFWSCLASLLVFAAVSLRAAAGPIAAAALTLTVVSWAKGVPGDDAVLETMSVPLMGLLPLMLVRYATRCRDADAEVARLKDQVDARRESDRRMFLNVAHEFRSPLTIASGHLDLVIAEPDSLTALDDIAVARAELTRLSLTIDRVLDAAVAGPGGFLERRSVNFGAVLEGSVDRWSRVVPRVWSIDVGPPGTISVDVDRITAALDALIENAVAYTSDLDTIAVDARADGGDLVIAVRDTGRGIAAGRRHTIGGGPRPESRRTGLGLAIVREVVERHGGTTSIDSAIGKGTTVSLRLPGFRPVPTISTEPPTLRKAELDGGSESFAPVRRPAQPDEPRP